MPLAQHHHPVAERQCFGLVMGDEDGGQPERLVHLLEPGTRPLAQLRVEVGQRLIEQQQARLVDQRAGNRYALLLTTRELIGIAVGQLAEFEPIKHVAGALLALGRGNAADAQRIGDVLLHRHMRPQRIGLEHIADIALLGGHVDGFRGRIDDVVTEADFAAGWLVQPADEVEQRGLAATARSQQRGERAGRHCEADAVEHGDGAVGLAEIAQVDCSGHGASPLRKRRWRPAA